jgi:cellulose biosynthesis protein BcsQ
LSCQSIDPLFGSFEKSLGSLGSMDFYNPEHCRNEAEVESKFIVHYLLPALGYSPTHWNQEVTFGRIRLDFLANVSNGIGQGNQLPIVLEAKHPRQNLDRHVRKFLRYLEQVNARHGLLINGKQIRVYEQAAGEIHLRLQVLGRELPDRLSEISALIGRETLQSNSSRLFPLASIVPKEQITSTEKLTMKIIAVYHNKGGVGKTTTVINLAAALSKRGKKVLVIDLDSQANTTYALGLIKFQDEQNDDIRDRYVYHVLAENKKFPIAEVVRRSNFSSSAIDVIPSHIELMEREQELIQLAPSLTRLVKKLKDVEHLYDVVLIDTPPSLNLYAKVALISADFLLIPSDLKPFANEGLRNVQRFVTEIDDFRDSMGRKAIEILGVLASKVATHAKFVEHTLPKMEAIIEERYGFRLLRTRIYERRDVSLAIERMLEVGDLDIPNPQSVLDFKPDSASAQEFEDLAKEVLVLIREL